MNNFKAKFWQYLNLRNREQGLTLIELLIVIFIIGILSAIALPSVLGMASKSKEVEAINTIKYLNTVQQIYYSENLSFTDSLETLNLSSRETKNYTYITVVLSNISIAIHAAVSKNSSLKHYGGVVYLKNKQPVTCGPLKMPNPNPPTPQQMMFLYYTYCP